MTLKNRIRLSVLTMLLLLLIVGVYSYNVLHGLDRRAQYVRRANLHSVELGRQMLWALSGLTQQPARPAALEEFRRALTREGANITEPGEAELVDSLTQNLADYQRLLDNEAPLAARQAELLQLQAQTNRLLTMNLAASGAHGEEAARTVRAAKTTLLLILVLSTVLGVSLVLRLPRIVVRPLRRLSADIELANPSTGARLPIERQDEVGHVAQAFNRVLGQMQDLRTASRAELLMQRNRMESIVQGLDEGLLLIDQNRRIILVNPVASELLGQPAEALIGQLAADVAQHNEFLQKLLDAEATTPPRDSPEPPEYTVTRHGEEAYYRLSVNPILSYNELTAQTEFVGHILSLRNISDFKKLDQVKSNFLATVSHELKTPLASINLSLKLLQDERTDTAERQRIAGGIRLETQRLLRMVGELIDVSRLDAGVGIKLNPEPVALALVMDYADDTIMAQLEDKQLELHYELPEDLPAVRADLEKTTWVVINLMANAIRYSPPGEQIHISAEQRGELVQVSVRDCGPGIAPEYHERIFKRFAHIPTKEGLKGGSGLGLSISREFITSQGGELWVESQPGCGSVFHFTLPVMS
ncbi:HAMP domain-containing sensor histidine kinase [Hymenobacter metallicola]|uniref:histidine kinase n=1 Tax=Hymenobacter metallicola TaxID=2563114 RepID=A0A4Z0QFR2_9BACT|nr:ATP-binding protein [Hymenobacter metallicola]TGE28594.1 PAS domain-containing protein [Hymenobacter metallicola]